MSQARELSGYENAEVQGRLLWRELVLSPAKVVTVTCPEQIFACVGVLATDLFVAINKPTEQAGVGVFPQRVSSAGNLGTKWVNPTAGDVTPTAGETYDLLTYRRGHR